MWGKPPFSIADNCAIDVRNLAASHLWYKKKLGLREAPNGRAEDSGRPFVDLRIADNDTFISLLELKSGASPERTGHFLRQESGKGKAVVGGARSVRRTDYD